MSRLYMHFQEGPVLGLLGSERFHLDHVSRNAAFGAMGLVIGSVFGVEDALNGLAPFLGEEFAQMDPRDRLTAERIRNVIDPLSSRADFRYGEKVIEAFALRLNTAIVFGSDPVALAAKMHGTCEIHGYFLGKDRAWLADVIEQGLDANIFRRNLWAPRDRNADLQVLMKFPVTEHEAEYVEHSMGWTEIVEQLRKSNEGAVVMSYSVTDSFPQMPEDWEPEGPIREPENDWETRGDIKREMFDELPNSEKFALALAQRQKEDKPIGPGTLRTWLFRHQLTLLDLMCNDIKKIEKHLGLEG